MSTVKWERGIVWYTILYHAYVRIFGFRPLLCVCMMERRRCVYFMEFEHENCKARSHHPPTGHQALRPVKPSSTDLLEGAGMCWTMAELVFFELGFELSWPSMSRKLLGCEQADLAIEKEKTCALSSDRYDHTWNSTSGEVILGKCCGCEILQGPPGCWLHRLMSVKWG